MKVTFVCPSISRALGGIFEVERKLAQSLVKIPDVSLDVLGVEDEHTQEDMAEWLPIKPRYFAAAGVPSSFRYSSGLKQAVMASDANLLHMHALWTHNSVIVNRWAQRWKRPYVITANGMLDQWAVQNSYWKKRLALALYERKCLSSAACIHALCEAEYKSARQFGLRNPICIIPNGIDLPAGREEREPPWQGLIPNTQKVLLYLGRLHPKKGLVNLLKAWAQIKNPAWTLAIAGWDQGGHAEDLKDLATESVVFLGPRFAEEKSSCYQNCDAFVLPSFSEGLPIVVLEAWSHSKPVLITPECNLPEGFSSKAALRIEPNVASISLGLRELFAMSDADRRSMGENGYLLAKTRFSWANIAADLHSVYAWLLNAGPKPSCVVD